MAVAKYQICRTYWYDWSDWSVDLPWFVERPGIANLNGVVNRYSQMRIVGKTNARIGIILQMHLLLRLVGENLAPTQDTTHRICR